MGLGHSVQVEQVLLNLFANARDALKENNPENRRSLRVSITPGTDGATVQVSVADNAGGVDSKIQDRIFEPFFSSKEIGKGTGLGLSISYGIIKDMGGSIRVNNQDGGAVFTIELPVAETAQKTD